MTKLLAKLFIKNYTQTDDKDVRKRYGFLSGIVGIVMNILLFSGKILAGVFTCSISVIADAFNNLSDAGSSIITLIGFKIASAPPDKEHPFGHGRAEYLAGLIVSFIICFMGFELAKSSIEKIITPEEISFDVFSLVMLVASILVKLWLCLFNRKLGSMIDSVSMKATAMDSLSDVITTTAVILGIVFFACTGINIDGYVGVLVAAFIIYTGIKTAKESLSPLLGQMPDKQLCREIADTVCGYKDIVGVHDLIIHNYGVGVSMISLHAEVPDSMNFTAAHELIDIIEDDLKIKYSCIATIHMDPVSVDDEETNTIRGKVKLIVKAIDSSLSIHDFRLTKGEVHSNLIFDVVAPYNFRLNDVQLRESICQGIKAIDSKYFVVINVDHELAELD